jgi:hypothetical protein
VTTSSTPAAPGAIRRDLDRLTEQQAPPSWALPGLLPTWLDALDLPARERIGRALDAGTIRLVLGDDSRVVVARARP